MVAGIAYDQGNAPGLRGRRREIDAKGHYADEYPWQWQPAPRPTTSQARSVAANSPAHGVARWCTLHRHVPELPWVTHVEKLFRQPSQLPKVWVASFSRHTRMHWLRSCMQALRTLSQSPATTCGAGAGLAAGSWGALMHLSWES